MTSALMESVAGCLEVEAFRVAALVEKSMSAARDAVTDGDYDRARTVLDNAAALADFAASVIDSIDRIRRADPPGSRPARPPGRHTATGTGIREASRPGSSPASGKRSRTSRGGA